MAGLHFIGEVVDVTGRLGGFNFQWAWASGFAPGSASEEGASTVSGLPFAFAVVFRLPLFPRFGSRMTVSALWIEDDRKRLMAT